MQAPIEEIKRVFFEAMNRGYAVGGPKETLPDGSKQYVYEEGEWKVVDRYWVNEGTKYSCGYTLITYQGQPVWQMQYWGWYNKEAIPFLKEALRENYNQKIFTGGRGPQSYTDKGTTNRLWYGNCGRFGFMGSFENFAGEEVASIETIGQQTKVIIGTHSYQGGLLFKPDPIAK